MRCGFFCCRSVAGFLFGFERGLILRRSSRFRHRDLIIQSDGGLVGREAHEYDGAKNEHRRYWNEPAKIQPTSVKRFALRELGCETCAGCGGFRLRRGACRAQGDCWDWPCARESWFEREIGLHYLPGAGARHCGELFAAARASGEMKLVSGSFVRA